MPTILNSDALSADRLSLQRFTDCAQRVLSDSVERARLRGLTGVIPELIVLWSMLNWEKKIGLYAIEACGVDLSGMRDDVAGLLDSLRHSPPEENVDFARVATIAERACELSKERNHDYVGTEHVLVALCESREDSIQGLFSKHAVTQALIEANLSQLLQGIW